MLAVTLLSSEGCARRRYRQISSVAAEALTCADDEVSIREDGNVMRAQCNGRQASCDTYGGVWICNPIPEETPTDSPVVAVKTAIATRTRCPADQIATQEVRVLPDGRTGVGVIACGERVVCAVTVDLAVSCQNEIPAEAVDAEAEPAPAAATCEPACRTGYVCSAGKCVNDCGGKSCAANERCVKQKCVSACNPPCSSGESCTAAGECSAKK
jgi:hypothetical protein